MKKSRFYAGSVSGLKNHVDFICECSFFVRKYGISAPKGQSEAPPWVVA